MANAGKGGRDPHNRGAGTARSGANSGTRPTTPPEQITSVNDELGSAGSAGGSAGFVEQESGASGGPAPGAEHLSGHISRPGEDAASQSGARSRRPGEDSASQNQVQGSADAGLDDEDDDESGGKTGPGCAS